MKKILVCCSNGVGSSMLMKMRALSVFEKNGMSMNIDHCALGEAETIGRNYEVILCPKVFESKLNHLKSNTIVIGIQNILSEEEIEIELKKREIIK